MNEEAVEDSGRVLALDLGERRIGLAISDESRQIARSLAVIKRKSRAQDYLKIGEFAQEHDVRLVVVGLPLTLTGKEGSRATWARDYGTDLASTIGVQVLYWDESLSTVDAEASLRERGVHGQRRRKKVDAVAAAFILQSYLDAKISSAKNIDSGQ